MIVVTGASRGLGHFIAERLVLEGHDVIGLARTVVPSSFRMLACDVSDAASVRDTARALRHAGVPVKALINAAGIASMNLAVTTPAATVERLIQTNLLGTIYCCQQFAPLMMRRKQGRIINFSTIAVSLGLKGEAAYVASKAGVEGFSRSFAREAADFGVTVNCIAPGPINTDLLNGVRPEQIQALLNRQILPRQFLPEDVADLASWLLDDRAANITGQVLHLGGA